MCKNHPARFWPMFPSRSVPDANRIRHVSWIILSVNQCYDQCPAIDPALIRHVSWIILSVNQCYDQCPAIDPAIDPACFLDYFVSESMLRSVSGN